MRNFLRRLLRNTIGFQGFRASLWHTLFSAGVQVCQFFCTYLFIHFLTTYLTPEDFGLYSISKATAETILLIASFGLTAFLGREIPASEEFYQNKIFANCLRIQFLVFAAAIFLLLLFHSPLFRVLQIQNHKTFFIGFMCLSAFGLFHVGFISFLNFKKKISLSAILSALEQLFIVLFAFMIIKMASGLTLRLLGFAFLGGYISLFIVENVFLPKRFWAAFVRGSAEPTISFRNQNIFALLIMDIIFLFFFQIEKFLLSSYRGLEAAGLFSYGLTWILMIWRLSRMPFIFTYPHFAEFFKNGDWVNARKSLFFSVSSVLALSLLGSALALAFGATLFPYISSQQYFGGLQIMGRLFFVPCLINIAFIGQFLLVLAKKERAACLLFAIAFLFKVLLCHYLIPRGGLDGSVLSLSLSYLGLGIVLGWAIIQDNELAKLFGIKASGNAPNIKS